MLDSGGYLLSTPGSQTSFCVAAKAASLNSAAYRSSASLPPAQRALGCVMSQVKRCAQSGSSPR
ncbi:MAG TPA: hypothetical protein PKA81_02275, partial [Clostridia bacterium]|nr:hypothetical protein [Clostridia bacterium]